MQLTKEVHGVRVRCKIGDEQINDAKICYEGGKFYICQNERKGCSCIDKLGYKYGWSVGDGSERSLDVDDVTDLRPLSNEVRYAQKGDIIVNEESDLYRKVFERLGDVLFVSYVDETPEDAVVKTQLSNPGTWMGFEDNGYTIYQFADGTKPGDYEKEEKESFELTIDQIAEKFGVDPKKVKIKKGDDAISGEGL